MKTETQQPVNGPVRGLVFGLPVAVVIWGLALLVVTVGGWLFGA